MNYSIVAVSPRDGKELKRPRKGQEVFLALKPPRGKLKLFPAPYPQRFVQSDVDGLNAILKASGPQNLIIYESKTAEYETEIITTKSGKKKKQIKRGETGKPIRKTKLTFHQARRDQRPVILKVTKTVKKIVQDGALRKRTKREVVDAKLARLYQIPKGNRPLSIKSIHLTGRTIFETIKNIKVAAARHDLKKLGADSFAVDMVLRVKHPTQGLVFAATRGFQIHSLRNFSETIAKEIKFKLADHGYRFTSLATLREFQEEHNEKETGADYFHIGRSRRLTQALRPIVPETPISPDKPVNPFSPDFTGGNSKVSSTDASAHEVSVSLSLRGYKTPGHERRKARGKKQKVLKTKVKKKLVKKPKPTVLRKKAPKAKPKSKQKPQTRKHKK